MRPIVILRKILRTFGLIEEGIAVMLLLTMTAITLLQVVGRYLMNNPFIWTEEVTRLTLIWLTFVAATAVTRRGLHLAVDAGLDMLAPRERRIVETVIHAVMALVFGWLAWIAWILAEKVTGLPLAATRWSMSVMVWPAAISCLLIAFHSVILSLAKAGAIPAEAVQADDSEVIRT